MSERLLRVREACERLRIGRSKFYGIVREGGITVVKVGGGTRVLESSVDTYIAGCARGVTAGVRRAAA